MVATMWRLGSLTILLIIFCTSSSASTTIEDGLKGEQLAELRQILSPINLLQNFNSNEVKFSPLCAISVLNYLQGISHLRKWALQMLDATAKIPEGIMYANHEFLGVYDECIDAVQENNTYTGQHCVLQGILNLHFNGIPAGQKSIFFYGMCVPSLCTAADLNNVLSKVGNITKNFVTLTADENYCHKKSEIEQPETGGWVVVGLISLLGMFGLISTGYDLYKQSKKEKGHPILMSFSLIQNGKALFSTNSGGDQMHCLNGIRVFSMAWVVYFHIFTSIVVGPIMNLTQAFADRSAPLYSVLANAYLAVDSFLLIAGFLLTHTFFRSLSRTGSFDVPMAYINRYFRLTPSYAMVILFHVTLYKYIGDGPMWYFVQNSVASPCTEYWWTGLLYVQNYANPNKLCLTQTWYLSADMQLYWISPLILYPMWKWRKFGAFYITALILIFTALPFGISYAHGFSPIPLIDKTGDQNAMDNYPTHSRATPWLVGVALAYLMISLKERKVKINFSMPYNTICWLAAGVIGGLSLFGLLAFENGDKHENFEAPFYLAFHRLGWSVALSWLIFASTNSLGGPINTFLSWEFFQPLGKLSYGVYLTHVSVILYRIGIMRTNNYFNLAETFFMFIAVWVVSHFVSMFLYLLIEEPFGKIFRHLVKNVKILPLPRKINKKPDAP